jgi:uncharacterized protein (UPF0335 family)
MLDQTPMKETAADSAVKDGVYRVTAGELRQYVERAERLASDIDDLREEVKDVFAEAKARGYDVKVLRKLIALRKRDASEVSEEEAILDLYKEALGMGSSRRAVDPRQTDFVGALAQQAHASGKLGGLGTVVDLTEGERIKGAVVAAVDAKGIRTTISRGNG